MALDRVAERSRRAHQVLAVELTCRHSAERLGAYRQASLDRGTRLPGAQAGTRPGPLRGPGLARLPSSRHAVHRRVRVLIAERSLFSPSVRVGELKLPVSKIPAKFQPLGASPSL